MSVNGIVQVLDQLTELHLQLLDLNERKKQVLIGNEINELMYIVQQENKLANQVARLEEERVEAVRAFLKERQLRLPDSIKISEIIRLTVKLEEKQTLAEAQKKLQSVISELKQLNQLNQKLVEQSLMFINYSLDLLSEADDEHIYRNPAQQLQKSNKNNYFDAKA